jgi:transcriptional regulator with XRE-family HTH domain
MRDAAFVVLWRAGAGAQVMRSLSSVNDSQGRVSDAASAAAALGRYAGDEKLAAIFKQMREIVGVSQSEMARRLGTNVSTLLDFEAGAVTALPSWPETVRIVDRYAELSQVDPSPLLTRLLQLQTLPEEPGAARPIVPVRPQRTGPVQALAADPTPYVAAPPYRDPVRSSPAGPMSPMPATMRNLAAPLGPNPTLNPTFNGSHQVAEQGPAEDHAAGFDGRSRTRETTVRSARQPQTAIVSNPQELAARRKRRRRRTLLVVGPVLGATLLIAAMFMAPRPFYRVAQVLPAPVATPLFLLLDAAVAQTATVRDGLRWIEFDDPRLRKGDRRTR